MVIKYLDQGVLSLIHTKAPYKLEVVLQLSYPNLLQALATPLFTLPLLHLQHHSNNNEKFLSQ